MSIVTQHFVACNTNGMMCCVQVPAVSTAQAGCHDRKVRRINDSLLGCQLKAWRKIKAVFLIVLLLAFVSFATRFYF